MAKAAVVAVVVAAAVARARVKCNNEIRTGTETSVSMLAPLRQNPKVSVEVVPPGEWVVVLREWVAVLQEWEAVVLHRGPEEAKEEVLQGVGEVEVPLWGKSGHQYHGNCHAIY